MSRESHEVSRQAFWEDFDYNEPDYPQTHKTINFRKLAWWKEYHA